jgi:hypothetical protein
MDDGSRFEPEENPDPLEVLADRVERLALQLDNHTRQSNLALAGFAALILRTLDQVTGYKAETAEKELRALYDLVDMYQAPYDETAKVFAQAAQLLSELKKRE